jgi:regulator of ribosome biosynthesis
VARVQASYLAGVSTASMGKFDKRLKGEAQGERKLPGSRRKALPVAGASGEKDFADQVLGKVMRCASAF